MAPKSCITMIAQLGHNSQDESPKNTTRIIMQIIYGFIIHIYKCRY